MSVPTHLVVLAINQLIAVELGMDQARNEHGSYAKVHMLTQAAKTVQKSLRLGESGLQALVHDKKHTVLPSEAPPEFTVLKTTDRTKAWTFAKRFHEVEGRKSRKMRQIAREVFESDEIPVDRTLGRWAKKASDIATGNNVPDRRLLIQRGHEAAVSEVISARAIGNDSCTTQELKEVFGRVAQFERGDNAAAPASTEYVRRYKKKSLRKFGIHRRREENRSATRQANATVLNDYQLLLALAAALHTTFNEESWQIPQPDDILWDPDFIVNLDETIFEFEQKLVRVFGPHYLKRLHRTSTLKFAGRHCSYTPVVSSSDKMICSMFIFSHTKNGKKMTAEMKAMAEGANALAEEIESWEDSAVVSGDEEDENPSDAAISPSASTAGASTAASSSSGMEAPQSGPRRSSRIASRLVAELDAGSPSDVDDSDEDEDSDEDDEVQDWKDKLRELKCKLRALVSEGVAAIPTSQQLSLTLHKDPAVRAWSTLPHTSFFSTYSCFSNSGTFADLMFRLGARSWELRKEKRSAAVAANLLAVTNGTEPPFADPEIYLDTWRCPFVVVMDNLSIHKQVLAKSIADHFGMELLFLAPNQTDIQQPLDTHGFAGVKAFMREQVRHVSDLIKEQRVLNNIKQMEKDTAEGKPTEWEDLEGDAGPGEGYLPGLVASVMRGALIGRGNIRRGFADNGLFPPCPEKILPRETYSAYKTSSARPATIAQPIRYMCDQSPFQWSLNREEAPLLHALASYSVGGPSSQPQLPSSYAVSASTASTLGPATAEGSATAAAAAAQHPNAENSLELIALKALRSEAEDSRNAFTEGKKRAAMGERVRGTPTVASMQQSRSRIAELAAVHSTGRQTAVIIGHNGKRKRKRVRAQRPAGVGGSVARLEERFAAEGIVTTIEASENPAAQAASASGQCESCKEQKRRRLEDQNEVDSWKEVAKEMADVVQKHAPRGAPAGFGQSILDSICAHHGVD